MLPPPWPKRMRGGRGYRLEGQSHGEQAVVTYPSTHSVPPVGSQRNKHPRFSPVVSCHQPAPTRSQRPRGPRAGVCRSASRRPEQGSKGTERSCRGKRRISSTRHVHASISTEHLPVRHSVNQRQETDESGFPILPLQEVRKRGETCQ